MSEMPGLLGGDPDGDADDEVNETAGVRARGVESMDIGILALGLFPGRDA